MRCGASSMGANWDSIMLVDSSLGISLTFQALQTPSLAEKSINNAGGYW
jgi:hypothetical protein